MFVLKHNFILIIIDIFSSVQLTAYSCPIKTCSPFYVSFQVVEAESDTVHGKDESSQSQSNGKSCIAVFVNRWLFSYNLCTSLNFQFFLVTPFQV